MRINKLIFVILLFLAVAPPLSANEMTQGEMAGIIRSAEHPCARVLDLQNDGENAWKVTCNSGKFHVSKNADGLYIVTAKGTS